MTVPQLFLDGRPLRLGKRIGKGGEGEVYALDGRADQALKFYTSADPGGRGAKVEAMVRAGLANRSKLVSFPSAVIRDSNGQLAGFLMRLVQGHKPIHHLYAPGDRKVNFPGADYRFLVHTALNVARALAEVHARNCVIGDINHSGILVSDRAMVALIDADSFQITDAGREFLCAVGVPEYTPPELQGRSLTGIRRTPNHDAFGLAVIVFQLLCMGRHPFIGTFAHGDMPLERAITEHRFAYSNRRSVGMRPPPGTVSLKDFPASLAAAFEAAFDPAAQRPTAEQWAKLLEQLEANLKRCAANALHYYPSAASECPWCRMERTVGIVLFLPPPDQNAAAASAQGGFDLRAIWAAIEAVRLPPTAPPQPVLPSVNLTPSQEATKAAAGTRRQWTLNGMLTAAAGAGFAAAPSLWFVWLPLGGFNLFQWLGPAGTAAPIRRKLADAKRQWTASLDDWRRRCGGSEVHAARKALADAKQELADLPGLLRSRLSNYEANRRDFQLRSHLERHLVRTAKIKGVGPSLKAALASWGIENAQQVVEHRILAISGFGPAKASAMMAWRRQIEASFSFDPRPNALDVQEKAKITREAAQREDQLKAKLARGAQELTVATHAILTRQKAVDPALARAHHTLLQAQVDDALVSKPLLHRLLHIGVGWILIAIVALAAFTLVDAISKVNFAAPEATKAAPAPSILEKFDPPRTYRVTPGARVRSVNVRDASSGDGTAVEKLNAGATITAIGRSKAADGRWWIVYERSPGVLGYVAESLLTPVTAKSAKKGCAEGEWLARTLCQDAALKQLDSEFNAAYNRAVAAAQADGQAELAEGRRTWMAELSACERRPNSKGCLAGVYRRRLADLKAWEPEAGSGGVSSGPQMPATETPKQPVVESTPPMLRGNLSSLITDDDYPSSSLRNGEAGRVTVRLHVNDSGRADGCEIAISSGYHTLDEATCRLLVRRARYFPARDEAGRSVDGFISHSMSWRLSGF